MSFKTVTLIIITVLVTIIITQNNEPMNIKLLWKEVEVSKLLVLLSFLIIGLIVGLWIGLSRKKNTMPGTQTNHLSEEDREFIEP